MVWSIPTQRSSSIILQSGPDPWWIVGVDMFCRFWLTIIVFCGCSLAFAAPGDTANIQSLVREFMSAYANRDVAGCMALWSPRSPDIAVQRKMLEDRFSIFDSLKVDKLVFAPLEEENGLISIRVRTNIRGTGKRFRFGMTFQTGSIFQFVREEGRWKFWVTLSIDQRLFEAISTTSDGSDREKLLNDNHDWLSVDLVRLLGKASEQEGKRGRLSEAGRLLGLEFEVANKLATERSEEHTSELQSRLHLVCRLLLEKKKKNHLTTPYFTKKKTNNTVDS